MILIQSFIYMKEKNITKNIIFNSFIFRVIVTVCLTKEGAVAAPALGEHFFLIFFTIKLNALKTITFECKYKQKKNVIF